MPSLKNTQYTLSDSLHPKNEPLIRKKSLSHSPLSERPRERCLEKGSHTLSLRECLALLIHSGPPGVGSLGLATHLLHRPGEGLTESEQERAFFTGIESSGLAHLQSLSGLGPAAQARILAAFEIGRRYSFYRLRRPSPSKSYRPSVTEAACAQIDESLRLSPQEWLGFVPVYHRCELGPFNLVERGVRTHVNFDPVELFARLLSLRPSGFFLFHNHPTGSLEPSHADLELTDQVSQVSRQFGIQFHGHGIITPLGHAWIPEEEVIR